MISITTRLHAGQLRNCDVIPSWSKRSFSSPKSLEWLSVPPSLLYSGFQMHFLGVQWLGCETDHSPPSNLKAGNEWGYTSTSPYAFMVCTGTTSCLCTLHLSVTDSFIVLQNGYWDVDACFTFSCLYKCLFDSQFSKFLMDLYSVQELI